MFSWDLSQLDDCNFAEGIICYLLRCGKWETHFPSGKYPSVLAQFNAVTSLDFHAFD